MYSIYTCIGGGGGGRGQSTAHMTAKNLLISSYFIHVFCLHMYQGGGAFYSPYDRQKSTYKQLFYSCILSTHVPGGGGGSLQPI